MLTAEITTAVRTVAEGVRVIDISGEITAFSEDELARAHEQASAGEVRAVILNFEGLEYMNSGGIGLIVTNLIRAEPLHAIPLGTHEGTSTGGLCIHFQLPKHLFALPFSSFLPLHPQENCSIGNSKPP